MVASTSWLRVGPETASSICALMLGVWWACFADIDYGYLSHSTRTCLLAVVVLGSAAGTAAVARWRRLAAGAVLTLSPLVVVPAIDASRAARNYVELGLDPHTRVPTHFSGCITNSLWEARVFINNNTLRGLLALFGPMSSHYGGPLYTGEELRALVERRGRPLIDAYSDGKIEFADRTNELEESLRVYLDAASEDDGAQSSSGEAHAFTVTILDDRLLVVEEASEGFSALDVYDLRTGWTIRGYAPEFVAREHPRLAPAWQRNGY